MSGIDPSEPNSPASTDSSQKDFDDELGNGLMLYGPPFGLEKVYDYGSGGHHPVHLGDGLGRDGRYRVIHKLGNGGFANVWLCRDLEYTTPKHVALKILMADESTKDCPELRVNDLKEMKVDQEVGGKNICLPLDQFQIDGPNGSHICLVYPVLGPRVSRILKRFEEPDRTLRQVALQAVQTMAALHSHGICHGDFTPSNILLRISGLDGLSEEQVIQALGEPRRNRVTTESGESSSEPTAPRYLVHPVDFNQVGSQFVTNQACVIDFGESFEVSSPPKDLGIPRTYCSPELMLDGEAGIGSDLWALGCTLFEIRTGRKLFASMDDEVDDHLFEIILLLGRLPEPWWSKWETRRDYFEDETDPQGRAIPSATTEPLGEHPRSIRESLAEGLWYPDTETGPGGIHRDIPDDEVKIFAELLGRILQYNPNDRLAARTIQDHEWFKM